MLSLEDSQTNNKVARAITDKMCADGSITSCWEKLYTLSSAPSTPMPEIQDNCLPVGNSISLGLFPVISRFNHSCCPNAGYSGHPQDEEVQVVQAMRDIHPGEEIPGFRTNSHQANPHFACCMVLLISGANAANSKDLCVLLQWLLHDFRCARDAYHDELGISVPVRGLPSCWIARSPGSCTIRGRWPHD